MTLMRETGYSEELAKKVLQKMLQSEEGRRIIMTLIGENSSCFYASQIRQKFHRSSCEWAHEIRSYNLIEFHSHQEAVEAGYKACGTCSP